MASHIGAMSEMAKKILITGGAGYIGSHAVVALSNAGYEPVIVDNFSNSDRSVLEGLKHILGKEVVYHEVDCTDRAGMNAVFEEEGPIAGVIHFAAFKQVGESIQFPDKYHLNNVGSLKVLIEVMRAHGVRDLVFSSSCTVYGQADELPVTESANAEHALSPYGQTKIDCEKLLFASPDIKSVILRYFNPIGAHPSAEIGELPVGAPANLVPAMTRALADGKELVINGDTYPTPDGTCIRDYLHVMDLADAHVLGLSWVAENEIEEPEVFNLGMGRGYSVLEVVNTFEQVNGITIDKRIGPIREGDIVEIYADVKKAKDVLKWETKLGVGEALQHAWQWQLKLNG